MKISIVITTKNEEFNIGRLLESMHKIKSYIEVIIVDAGSTDKTCDIAKSYDFVKIISAPSSLWGGGRNIGVKKTSGNIIVFLDADTELTDKWYSELVNSMKRYDIVAGYSPRHIIAGLVMGCVLYFLAFCTPFFPAISWYLLLIFALLGLGIYLGVLFLFREFKKQDLDFFLNILRPKEMVKYVSSELKEKPR